MKRTKRTFLVLLILALLPAGVLFAKGQAEGDNEEISLTVLEWNHLNIMEIQEAMQSAVHEHYPNINLVFENIDWSADWRSIMQTRIASNTMHDIIMVKGNDVPEYALEDYFMDLTSEEFMKEFAEGVLDGVSVNESVYAIPYTANYQGIFYNKDLFEEYDVEVPSTFEEYQEVVEIFRSNNITPFVAHYLDYQIGNITMQFAMAEVFSQNPQWGLDLQRGDVSFSTSPGYRDVFKHAKYYYDNAQKDPFGADFSMATQMFANGDIAMYHIGSWAVDQIMQNGAKFEMGIFAFPGKASEPNLLVQTDMTFAGNRNSKYPEAVSNVLEILATDKKLAKKYNDLLGSNSLLPGVSPTEKQAYHDDVSWYEENGRLVDVNVGNVQIPWPYQEEYSSYLADWLLDRSTLDEALKRADAYKENVNFPLSP